MEEKVQYIWLWIHLVFLSVKILLSECYIIVLYTPYHASIAQNFSIFCDSKLFMNTVADRLVTLRAGGSYPVKAFFTNPLSKSLTNVMFHIEGAKLTKSQKISGRYAMASAVL